MICENKHIVDAFTVIQPEWNLPEKQNQCIHIINAHFANKNKSPTKYDQHNHCTKLVCFCWSPSSITGLAWTIVTIRAALSVAVATVRGGAARRSDLLTLPLVLAQPFYSSPRWIITKNKEPYLCRDHFGGILNCDFYLLTNSNLFGSCKEAPRPGKTIAFIVNLPGRQWQHINKAPRCNLQPTSHALKVLLSCDINLK